VSKGDIEFKNVAFHYGKEGGVIDAFSLKIESGERIGLVGQSGAGKSTLVNLLLRLYDVESGSIFIDGQDISQVTQESLREQIAMVTQDTSLLHRTIRENIAYGKPGASEAEIMRAAQLAKADEFIDELEDNEGNRGFDAKVGERGVKLSGGQRQRIAIARVILKNAPILILDEATSALDSEVEAEIQEQLETIMQGKTVLAIAHRLSTIAKMDRLVVLHDGAIIEHGTHAELISAAGVYARLWGRQSGGFLGDTTEQPTLVNMINP
jgi:ATP-binding cassette subfamily B multidrug efflux pump